MSLHTRQRHVVVVQRMAATIGGAGERVWAKDGAPIPVKCNVYPQNAFEGGNDGDIVNVEKRLAKIHQGKWPGDQHSEITHDGSTWMQEGPTLTYGMGVGTKSQAVVLVRTGAAPAEAPGG